MPCSLATLLPKWLEISYRSKRQTHWIKKTSQAYLKWLIYGTKTIEARLNQGDWTEMIPGDILTLYSGHLEQDFFIIAIHYAPSFEALYRRFGSRLFPQGPPYIEGEEVRYDVVGLELALVD